jgi:hypothetical protein
MPVKDIPFHNWTIRYRPASNPGEKVQWQVMDKKGDIKGKGEAMSDKDAVGDAENYIKKGTDTRQQSSNNVTIDFNVNFTKEFGDEFFANIVADNNGPSLLIAYDQVNGLKRSYIRNQKEKMTATTTRLTCIPMSSKEANNAGLQPNGRYIIGDKQDMGEFAMFPLIYQSTVQDKSEKMRMGKPGLTVAHGREMDEAIDPWQGYTKDDPKANAQAKAPKNAKQGTADVPFSELVQDTIRAHGVKWAFEYYVKKHGLPPRQFQIFAGLTADKPVKKMQGPAAPAPKEMEPEKQSWWKKLRGKLPFEE